MQMRCKKANKDDIVHYMENCSNFGKSNFLDLIIECQYVNKFFLFIIPIKSSYVFAVYINFVQHLGI